MSRGRDYLAHAVNVHEHQMNPIGGLYWSIVAATSFYREGDRAGLAEALSHVLITGRRAATEYHLPLIPTLAEQLGRRSVRIAELAREPVGRYHAHTNLAKVQADRNRYTRARANYVDAQTALQEPSEQAQQFNIKHPSLLPEVAFQLAICAYKIGHTDALIEAEKILDTQLKSTNDPNGYADKVWKVGHLLTLVDCYMNQNQVKAMELLLEAKNIIDAHPNLGWRQHDWWRLAMQFPLDYELLFDQTEQKISRGERQQALYDYKQIRKHALRGGNREAATKATNMIRACQTRRRR